MNKIIWIALPALIAAGSAFGQSKLGIKGGLNYSNLAVDEDEIDDNNFKAAWTLGLFLRSNYDGIGFQGELLYTRKGASYQILGTTVDANLDYLELPLTLQLRLLGSPITVYGGAYAAYLLKAKYEYESNLFSGTVTYDDPDGFNDVDFGLLGGVNLSFGNVLIDGRMTRGLRDVESGDHVIDTHPFTANETKNFGFLLTLGLAF